MPSHRSNNNPPSSPPLPLADIKKWIVDDFTGDTIIFTEKFGRQLVKDRLTTSQIRNIFGEVKRIAGEALPKGDLKESKRAFLMLRPKMAYAAQRAGGRGIDDLKKVLDAAHVAVTEQIDQKGTKDAMSSFKRFVDLFEAILAYHKAAGGRD